jgi:hypothetical protein
VDETNNNGNTGGAHEPKIEFAKPLNEEPVFQNDATKSMYEKLGSYVFNHQEFDDSEAVKLGPHELENFSVYIGQWKNGVRHGRGKHLWKDGSIYEGYFKDNMAHGHGRLIHSDADVYEGEWLNDKAHGKGVYTHADGARYEGQWIED